MTRIAGALSGSRGGARLPETVSRDQNLPTGSASASAIAVTIFFGVVALRYLLRSDHRPPSAGSGSPLKNGETEENSKRSGEMRGRTSSFSSPPDPLSENRQIDREIVKPILDSALQKRKSNPSEESSCLLSKDEWIHVEPFETHV